MSDFFRIDASYDEHVLGAEKDFIEQGKKPVKKIPWGSPDYIPKCWAEDVWKWKNVNNRNPFCLFGKGFEQSILYLNGPYIYSKNILILSL